VNRRDLVVAVADHTQTEPRQVDALLRGLTDVITAKVSKGETIAISGFAKFARVDRKARMGRNPATGEPIKIKASRKARITPLKAFKDAVLGVTAAPRLTAAKAPAKKAAPARRAVKKAAPAKRAVKKKTVARKPAARKPAARKTTARKTTARKTTARKR
jgi:DNA-binding protein HU-beta